MRKFELKIVTFITIVLVSVTIIGLAAVRALVMETSPPREGARLFQEKGCRRCHFIKSRESRVGPGLKGLFDRQNLPVSGRPVTGKNVSQQLIDPYQNMPVYKNRLTKAQRAAIIDYLKTL